VANVYVDDDGRFRFLEVATDGFVGLGKEHHPVPIEAVDDADPGSITLKVGRRTVESVPTLGNPDAAPDGTMYVRISTMQVLEGEFDRILHFFRNALLPATEMQPGFRGVMLIENRDESTIVTATWWNSQERMEETARCQHLPATITELARYLAGPPTVVHYQLETIPRRRAEPDLSQLRDLPRAEAMRLAMLEYGWDCATSAKMVDVVQGRYVQDRAGRNNPQSALTPEPRSAPEP
jgi:heme-degrading monooxygenase HmoA